MEAGTRAVSPTNEIRRTVRCFLDILISSIFLVNPRQPSMRVSIPMPTGLLLSFSPLTRYQSLGEARQFRADVHFQLRKLCVQEVEFRQQIFHGPLGIADGPVGFRKRAESQID